MTTPHELIARTLAHDEAADSGGGRWESGAWAANPVDGPTKFRIWSDEAGHIAFTYGYTKWDSDVAALIAAYRTDAPLLARMNAMLLDALDEIQHDMGPSYVGRSRARAALLKAEEMCRE